jgi:hypothetical protein
MIRIAITAAAFEAIAAMLAAFALGGCTANQMLSQQLQPLPPGTPRVVARPSIPSNMRRHDFYVGGHHRSH